MTRRLQDQPRQSARESFKEWKKIYVHYIKEGIPGEYNKCQWNRRTTLWDHTQIGGYRWLDYYENEIDFMLLWEKAQMEFLCPHNM